MKRIKLTLLLTILMSMVATKTFGFVEINEKNFPDKRFREYLLSQSYGADGLITDDEIPLITKMVITTPTTSATVSKMQNMKGIEYFTALKELDCSWNEIDTLDLRNNPLLEKLNCSYHGGSVILGLAGNKNLKEVYSTNEGHPKLDLSNCINLTTLDCGYGCSMDTLDISGCVSLINLTLPHGNNYTYHLYNLNASGCTSLKEIRCYKASVFTLNASGCTSLEILECYQNSGLYELNVTGCAALKTLSCGGSNGSQLTTLDLSTCTMLEELYCDNSPIEILDLSGNPALKKLDCSYDPLTSLNISNCLELTELNCSYTNLPSVDVLQNKKLSFLDCSYNQLSSLDLTNNKELTEVYCQENKIKGLDFSVQDNLKILYCWDNPLEYLTIKNRSKLENLSAGSNNLSSLDVSGCSALSYLGCSSNQLTSLLVDGCNALTYIQCTNNKLTGKGVDDFFATLPTFEEGSPNLYFKNERAGEEGNKATKAQVAIAKEKGWKVWYNAYNWMQYEGEDPVAQVIADDKSREYGDDNPEFTYQVTEAEITGVPELTTTATKTSPVGTYPITVNKGTIVGDYEATDGVLTIEKAPLTITAKSYSIKQGDALPELEAEYAGFKNEETKDVLTRLPVVSCDATAESAPGEYPITVSGAEAGNYEVSYVSGTLTITEPDPRTHEIGDVFTAPTIEGVDMKFKVISETEVEVYGESSSPSIDKKYSGSITIPEQVEGYSVTTIGDYAFLICFDLTSVTIPNSVTSIGESAFSDCSGLTSITIPNSVTTIGDYAFSSCSGLTSIIVALGNTKYDSRNNCNAIIETASNTLLYGCKKTTIPNSVTSIGDWAFYGCSGLTSVTIPNSVMSIGNSAFRHCTSLTSVTIPNSVTIIGGRAFSGCSALTSITIPNSVTSIDSSAFSGCSKLTSVALNSNAIVSKAYTYSSNIKNIFGSQVTEYIIGDEVTSIGNSAFEGCSKLSSVTIPNSVTSIVNYAFWGCSGLTSITIGNSVTSIGYGAFRFCSGLTSVTIPNSVTSIGGSAFYGCSGLTSVTIPNSVTSIGSDAFADCSGLTSVTIGNSVTSIGSSAFKGCSGLTSVTIGNSVTSIGDYAFTGCSALISVTIPNSVTSIGEYNQEIKGKTNVEIIPVSA